MQAEQQHRQERLESLGGATSARQRADVPAREQPAGEEAPNACLLICRGLLNPPPAQQQAPRPPSFPAHLRRSSLDTGTLLTAIRCLPARARHERHNAQPLQSAATLQGGVQVAVSVKKKAPPCL